MLIVLALHFVVASGAPWLFARWGRHAFYVLAAVPAGSFIWLLFQHNAVYSPGATGPPTELVPWVPDLQLELAFRMDALAWLMSLLVLGVGALVLVYCARYFKSDDGGLGGFGSQLLAFAGVMFGLVTADNLLLLYVFWELTTVLSYLLIGYSRTRIAARRAALQALVVTTLGGLAMLVGLIIIGQTLGTYRISAVVEQAGQSSGPLAAPGSGGTAALLATAVVLVLAGAATKSALIPFHFWLPAAMAAPTPVSAYLHAAAMVKAGIYLVARLAPGFSGSPYWQVTVAVLGVGTMLVGGWRALRQHDLKLILAYGTVSQLGFLTVVVGLGNREAAVAGLALLLAHGLFKATLFLVVGIIDHHTGTRDIRKLSGVFAAAPALGVVAALGAASMAGVPPLAGFIAKESVYEAFLHNAFPAGAGGAVDAAGAAGAAGASVSAAGVVVLVGLVLGSVLTIAYSVRFLWGGFARKERGMATAFKPVSWKFLAAPAVLSAATVLYGLLPSVVDGWVAPYARLFDVTTPAAATVSGTAVAATAAAAATVSDSTAAAAPGTGFHLALWHGFTPALALTAATFAAAVLLAVGRRRVARFQGRIPPLLDAEKSYRHVIGGLDSAAVWITGRTQRGSLFFYLAVILSVAIGASLTALAMAGWPAPKSTYFIDPKSPAQVIAGVGIILGALAAVRANKRFLAVLMVSVTGYGVALIFALQGAPDLALTQMLVETIILVAFVLAMRSLPAKLRERTTGSHRLVRLLIGLAFGATMVLVALAAMGARTALPVSLEFPQLAYQGGGGLNIVNVTLVDIRAWDTFGEISVLAIAATGVASLIFVRGRGARLARADSVEAGSVGRQHPTELGTARGAAALALNRKFADAAREAWLVAGRTLAPERRSIIFEVVTRLLFHSMIIFSIYLLLAGHNLPGGGFSGGLMAGMALTIRYLAGGRFELAEAAPVSAGIMLGSGLGLAALSGLAPLLLGGEVFQSAVFELFLPVFGEVKFVTSTIFDVGVYLIVVGLVLDVLRSLGAQLDQHQEDRAERQGRTASEVAPAEDESLAVEP
ncbi:MAG TPA: Na+/H+ antiporter subunit A [Micrococcaceae bacterium]|nr:Na+/H+ antiporter subunit A [Micrococcaceae bacterium]